MADYTERIQARKATDLDANWSEENSDVPGYCFQLILDNGAEERVIRPVAEDADILMDLFAEDDSPYFDLGHGVLIFRDPL